MPIYASPRLPIPNYWTIFGHSWYQNIFGTRTQAGRSDSMFRNMLNIDHTSFANFAVTGSRLSVEGNSQGGYVRLLQNVKGNTSFGDAAPRTAQGGAYLLGYGINDVGFNTQTAQFNTAYAHAMRMAISRCRASTFRENDFAGGAGTGVIAYGSGFTLAGNQQDIASGTSVHTCTTTGVNATVTITLASDYAGEVVCLSFICPGGVLGGTVTYSGTALASSAANGTTTVLSNIQPATQFTHSPVVKRITDLSSANQGQTIVITVTQIDAGGSILFNAYWLEAVNPNPVLVQNTARCTTAGYAQYGVPPVDSDIATFNAALYPVLTEFDAWVQMIDVDSALNKDATLFGDGLHPNELGAGKVADAIFAAVARLPMNKWGTAAAIQPPSPRTSAVVVPAITARYYTSQCDGGPTGTYAPVAGDMWAIPFQVTSGLSKWTGWAVEMITSTVATTCYMSIYDDRRFAGYPQQVYSTPANQNATPLSLSTGAGLKPSPTSAGNGFLAPLPPDPGLYWLVFKIITAGTSSMRGLVGPSLWVPNLTAGGLGFASGQCPAGWLLAGQGSTNLPTTFPAGAVNVAAAAGTAAPAVSLLIG